MYSIEGVAITYKWLSVDYGLDNKSSCLFMSTDSLGDISSLSRRYDYNTPSILFPNLADNLVIRST